jgi:hypothetical protein
MALPVLRAGNTARTAHHQTLKNTRDIQQPIARKSPVVPADLGGLLPPSTNHPNATTTHRPCMARLNPKILETLFRPYRNSDDPITETTTSTRPVHNGRNSQIANIRNKYQTTQLLQTVAQSHHDQRHYQPTRRYYRPRSMVRTATDSVLLGAMALTATTKGTSMATMAQDSKRKHMQPNKQVRNRR